VASIGLGISVAAAAFGTVASGVLRGVPLLLVIALSGLVVPTSRELSRRALIAGCVFFGWVPMTWWWHLPVGRAGHLGLVLGVVVGGLAGWVAWDSSVRRLRSLMPRLRWTDLVAAAGALGAGWIYAPGLRAVSPEVALSRLLRGWDNSAHFDMAEMISRYGVMIDNAPAGPLGEWAYAAYPQGFHAVAATVMEAGVGVGEPAQDLAVYARALTLVVVVALATVIAGVCSLPALRRRPLVALPLTALVLAAFGFGPGGMLLHNGFPNFYVALAMLCCIPIVAVQITRPAATSLLAALGGAALGVAHNWALLLSMGALGAVAVVFPWRRARWPRAVAEWRRGGAVVLATALGLVAAWSMLRRNPSLGEIININGGVTPVPNNQVILSAGVAVAACTLVGVRVHRAEKRVHGDDAVRVAWIGLIPATGLVVAVLIALSQVRSGSGIGYYFWKYAIALEVVSLVVLSCAVPILAPKRTGAPASRWSGAGHRVWALVVSVVAAVAMVQAFGTPPRFPTLIGGGPSPGTAARDDYAALSAAPLPEATMLVGAVRADDGTDKPHVFAVASPGGQVPQMMLAQWFHALTGRWTSETDRLMREVDVPAASDAADLAESVRAALRLEPDVVVVVEPAVFDEVRGLLETDGDAADHVTSW
jgi:hypothetical protein